MGQVAAGAGAVGSIRVVVDQVPLEPAGVMGQGLLSLGPQTGGLFQPLLPRPAGEAALPTPGLAGCCVGWPMG